MTGVLTKEKDIQTQRQESMPSEDEDTPRNVKDGWRPPEAVREVSPPEPLREHGPINILVSDF